MSDRSILTEYYKRKLYGGRGFFARCMDFLFLRAVVLGAAYLFFSGKTDAVWLRWFLGGVLLALFCICAALYKSIRLDKFKLREQARIQQAYAREQLLLLPGKDYAALVRAYASAHKDAYPPDWLIYPLQQSMPLSRDRLLCILRLARCKGSAHVALFSTAPVSGDAEALLESASVCIEPQGFAVLGEIANAAGLLPDVSGVESYILENEEKKKLVRKKSVPIAPERVKRYLLAAIGLFAFSFFAPYALYYRLMGIACVSLGSLSWWVSRGIQQKL